MGSGKKLWLWGVLLVILTCSCLFVSPSPLHKAFLSDSLQEHGFARVSSHGHHINGVADDRVSFGRNSIADGKKFGRGAGSRGGNGGESAGRGGESAGNGNSETPKGGGTAAVIPVIIAGGANHGHHQHHGAATSHNKNLVRLPTFIFLAWASLVVHLRDLV